jgi:hypothetical protein
MEGSRIVFPVLEKRSREVWMQSEPRRPQIILSYIGGHVVKSAHGYPSEARLRGEAPVALPLEGALSPDNGSRFLHADRPDLHVDPKPLLPPFHPSTLPLFHPSTLPCPLFFHLFTQMWYSGVLREQAVLDVSVWCYSGRAFVLMPKTYSYHSVGICSAGRNRHTGYLGERHERKAY